MRLILVVALFALFVPGAGAWTQAGGGADHAGVADLAQKEWDIQEVVDLSADRIGTGPGLGLAAIGSSLYGIEVTGGTCQLVNFYPERTVLGAAYSCTDGRIVAATGAGLIACLDAPAGAPLVVHWSLAGQEIWVNALPVTVATLPGLGDWQCGLPAMDGGALILPLVGPARQHRIDWISIDDGTTTTSVVIPATTFIDINETVAGALGPASDVLGLASDFRPGAVTRTRDGLLAIGRFGAGDAPAAAALSLSGDILAGIQLGADTSQGTGQIRPMSQYAAAYDERAAAIMGDQLLSADPGAGVLQFAALGRTALSATTLPGPAWGPDGLVLPTEGGAYLARSRDAASTKRYEAPDGGRVQDVMLIGNGQAMAVGGTHRGAHLARFDATTGHVLHAVPLPFVVPGGDPVLHLLPAGDALWVWSDDGQAVRLAPAAAGADIHLDTFYPKVGEAVSLTSPADGRLELGWGDGTFGTMQAGTAATHRYLTGGDHTIRLTRVQPDNTTVTTTAVVHVGTDPPESLNFIQNAFSDDHWEVTVAILGFIASAVTLIAGIVAATRGRRRLDREMKAIDRIADQGRTHPFEAIKDLHTRRRHLRDQLRKGKLDEGQYGVILAHAGHVLQVLRQRILGQYGAQVSTGFERLVDVALTDGRVGAAEAQALSAAALQETALAKPDRDRLAALVRSWQSVA